MKLTAQREYLLNALPIHPEATRLDMNPDSGRISPRMARIAEAAAQPVDRTLPVLDTAHIPSGSPLADPDSDPDLSTASRPPRMDPDTPPSGLRVPAGKHYWHRLMPFHAAGVAIILVGIGVMALAHVHGIGGS